MFYMKFTSAASTLRFVIESQSPLAAMENMCAYRDVPLGMPLGMCPYCPRPPNPKRMAESLIPVVPIAARYSISWPAKVSSGRCCLRQ